MTTTPGAPDDEIGERRITHVGKTFETHERDKIRNGKKVVFEYAERSPGARIIVTDGKGVMLTQELREELHRWDYRVPGGKVFDRFADYAAVRDDKEAIERAARAAAAKELREEALLDIGEEDLRPVHVSIAGATIIWDLHYFVVKVAFPIPPLAPRKTEEGEEVGRAWVSKREAVELFCAGAMGEERSAAVLMKLILTGEAGFGAPPKLDWAQVAD